MVELTDAFSVKIKRYSSANKGIAFLGKGADGRAFELEDFTPSDDIVRTEHVLKVISGCTASEVEFEFNLSCIF